MIRDLFGICDKGFIWNASNFECECDKSSDVGEYLDYKNCKCRNKLVDKLVEECIENIDGNKMLHNETLDVIPLNDYKNVCNSCTILLCTVLSCTILSCTILAQYYLAQYYLMYFSQQAYALAVFLFIFIGI